MTQNASISVVIPTYRRPDLLARLLQSVSRQTLPPLEVIVVDDASGMDDQYAACIAASQSLIPNLQFYSLPHNSGAPHARNVGVRRAKGEWIALVDDDDEWLPEKLAKQWQVAQQADQNVGLIYTWADTQRDDGQVAYASQHLVRGDARRAILSTNFILSASVMVRKRVIEQAGLFDETLPSCQDWDMWTRIFLKGFTCEVVPEVVTIYHKHDQPSIGTSKRALSGHLLFLKKHWMSILRWAGPLALMRLVKGILKIRNRGR